MTTTTTGVEAFCDITFTGTRTEVDRMRTAAYHSGRLVYMSTPRPVSVHDTRLRVVIRLTSNQ